MSELWQSGIAELKPHTVVVLDGGVYSAGTIWPVHSEDVSDGAYVLSVLAPDHVFDFIRIDVENTTVTARPHVLGTPFEPSVNSPTLAYPLTLTARGKNSYFVPREGFNVAGMFQNPMMMMMVITGVMVLFMPKLMESMGDEMKQEIEQKRHEMLGVGPGPGPGLPRDLDVGDAREALGGGGAKGGKGRRKSNELCVVVWGVMYMHDGAWQKTIWAVAGEMSGSSRAIRRMQVNSGSCSEPWRRAQRKVCLSAFALLSSARPSPLDWAVVRRAHTPDLSVSPGARITHQPLSAARLHPPTLRVAACSRRRFPRPPRRLRPSSANTPRVRTRTLSPSPRLLFALLPRPPPSSPPPPSTPPLPAMPLVRRKQVAMHPVPPELSGSPNDTRDVFYLEETGEIFLDYESYASRMTFYKMKVFQCETTGKGGLDYFQALQSEQNEASTLLARFPEPLKVAVLRSVQWQVVGRLDSLVDQVYDRYVDRYHAGEKIFVDVQGEKYWARILKVFPPKALLASYSAPSPNHVSSSTNPLGLSPLNPNSRPTPNGLSPLNPNSLLNSAPPTQVDAALIAHRIGGDLSIPITEAFAKDDPAAYFYQVQLIEEGDEEDTGGGVGEPNGNGANGSAGTKWAGSTMEVQMGVMSRDRLAFSKSILRRFIRECVTRDAAIASPWCVKPALAVRYGLETEMPVAMRKSAERVKAGELEKRKKVWEEKEERERPSKKPKKLGEDSADNSRAQSKVKETPTPAPVRRYPIEDLDVILTDRDRKAGRLEVRPPFSRDVPFAEWGPGACEKFLAVWFVLTTFSKPLQLSFFTMDEFEQALNHSYTPPTQNRTPRPVTMMAEIHATLLTHIRDRAEKPGQGPRQEALASLEAQFERWYEAGQNQPTPLLAQAEFDRKQYVKSSGAEEDMQTHVWRTKLGGIKWHEVDINDLIDYVREAEVGDWRTDDMGPVDQRSGWEAVLLGCLIEYGCTETFPRLRSVLSQLCRPPSVPNRAPAQSDAPKIATLDEPESDSEEYDVHSDNDKDPTQDVRWGWAALTPRDKLETLAFLADLVMTSRSVRSFMEECDARLTTLRKEKIEVNRERKRVAELLEESGVSVTKMEEKMNGANAEADELGGAAEGSEPGSKSATPLPESGTSTRRKSRNATAPNSTAASTPDPHPVNQRAAARAQAAEHKGLVKARQGHIEESARLDKQLAEIEREFRQLLGATRMKPLGKDRFYNRVWWFDGIAGVGKPVNDGKVKGKGKAIEKEREREAQGVGRIFIQGPEKGEWEYVMTGRDERVVRARRAVEEGDGCMLEPGEWAMYSEPEQIEEFIAWLNPKGTRELHLKNALAKWGEPLMAAVGKRSADISGIARGQGGETRRSSRVKAGAGDALRDSYLSWTNKRTR
ncbi:imitation switch two complex protein [Ceratobasidium sp. AG-Ba]|nr:imitation switch two complex protein [Ceratobasidium sp. AG-Ba]